jgi:hypothetical protein
VAERERTRGLLATISRAAAAKSAAIWLSIVRDDLVQGDAGARGADGGGVAAAKAFSCS